MCDEQDETLYSDYKKCIRVFTVIMNHLITNQTDAIHFQIMFILIFVLFYYQCIKIHSYAQQYVQQNSNKSLEFQIFFWFLSLVRINQLTYTVIGHQIDQNTTQWKMNGHELHYCDYQFSAGVKIEKCYVRYEINGFYSDINLYLNSLAIQMITFFLYKQISPSMFFYVPKVLMNQGITRRAKLIYLFVVLIDILMLIGQIYVCLYGYMEQWIQNLQYSQLIFICINCILFIYYILKQHRHGIQLERLDKLIGLGIIFFILVRIVYIVMRLFDFEYEDLLKYYKRTEEQSILYLIINIISEFGFRILLLKLF